MENPGENLKRERELRGVTLQKMHDATKVQMKYLVALEADDYASLPHPTFVRGFIKSYCKVLGLDETDALLRYEMYLRENVPETEVKVFPGGRAEEDSGQERIRRLLERFIEFGPRRAIAYVVVGLFVLALVYFFSARHRKAVAPPREEAPVAGTEDRNPPEPQEAPADARPEPAKAPVGEDSAPKGKLAVQEADKQAQGAGGKGHTLSIKATERTWIMVKIDNDDPFDVMLQKGESIVWKAERRLSVVVGNAGGVEMAFDGKRLQPLGRSGAVVDLVLPAAPVADNGAAREAPR